MTKRVNLLSGNIFESLIKLALPIMGTSFIQMAYNMTDMIWIGRIGSYAVAAVGTAGFFMWLSFGVIAISKIGAQVKVAQMIGANHHNEATSYARNALQMNFVFAVIYSIIIISKTEMLISFFNIDDKYVVNQAISYLSIIGPGLLFSFTNQIITGIIIGTGNSRTPFLITMGGLIFNIILDPMLIFGVGPFPLLGVEGAAIATISAQCIVFVMYIIYAINEDNIFNDFKLFSKPEIKYVKEIARIGLPTALQSVLFTFVSMTLARIIAVWGPIPIAVQKVGSQIESISWMTSDGFSSAINSFNGQNFGAKQYSRIRKGYYTSLKIISVIGIFSTLMLVFAAGPIFKIFIPEKEVLPFGVAYLRIMGLSQLFMCIEIVTQGAFSGLGKTIPPSIVSIVFTVLRIPMALMLSKDSLLGLNGVWWSVSISMALKGIILSSLFLYFIKNKLPKTDDQ